jgi:DNA repair exonuclease SbcCD ATPase subunit
MSSLGGRRGFQVTGRYSALGDNDLMRRISTRLHELQRLIQGKEGSLDEENQRLLDTVEELEDEVRSLSERLEKAHQMNAKHEEAVEELDDEKGELLSLINEALSVVYHEAFVGLGPAVRALVDEYSDVVEEAEDRV